jgi:hypothetical protein
MNQAQGATRAGRASPFMALSGRLGGWLTLAANLGVLGGLVLVVLQLNQNEKMMRAQTRHEIATGIAQLLMDTAGNPQLNEVMVRSNSGARLTPAEAYQVQMRLNAIFRLWEDEHYQYRMGLYDETEFTRERNTWKGVLLTNPGVLEFWCRNNKGNFSAEFARDMNGLIEPGTCAAAQRQRGS